MSTTRSQLLVLASLVLAAPCASAMDTSGFRMSDNVLDLRDVPRADHNQVTYEFDQAHPIEESNFTRTTDPDNLATQAGYWDIGSSNEPAANVDNSNTNGPAPADTSAGESFWSCLLYTSDAADE